MAPRLSLEQFDKRSCGGCGLLHRFETTNPHSFALGIEHKRSKRKVAMLASVVGISEVSRGTSIVVVVFADIEILPA